MVHPLFHKYCHNPGQSKAELSRPPICSILTLGGLEAKKLQKRKWLKFCGTPCRHNERNRYEKDKVWNCEELNWNDELCEFKSKVEKRLKNHITAHHEIMFVMIVIFPVKTEKS